MLFDQLANKIKIKNLLCFVVLLCVMLMWTTYSTDTYWLSSIIEKERKRKKYYFETMSEKWQGLLNYNTVKKSPDNLCWEPKPKVIFSWIFLTVFWILFWTILNFFIFNLGNIFYSVWNNSISSSPWFPRWPSIER